MDDEKLAAMRAAAAARGARGIERTSSAQVEKVIRAGSAGEKARSNSSTRSFEAVLRQGGRSGAHRKLDAATE